MTGPVGILGGSFDPIHRAHLAMAEEARRYLGLKAVHFVVCRRPPHKAGRTWVSDHHRFAMTALALDPCERFVADPLELERDAFSYTIDTLALFKQRHQLGAKDLWFIAGGDSLRDFTLWYRWEELLESCRFLFVQRSGVELSDAAVRLLAEGRVLDQRGATGAPESGSLLVEWGIPPFSSTSARDMLQSGMDCREIIPENVLRYIRKNGLYGAV